MINNILSLIKKYEAEVLEIEASCQFGRYGIDDGSMMHGERDALDRVVEDLKDALAAQVEAMTCDKMKLDIEAIEGCVGKISGLSYHQGTFAKIAHKYPDDFENYNKQKREEWKKLRELLNINNNAKQHTGFGRGEGMGDETIRT